MFLQRWPGFIFFVIQPLRVRSLIRLFLCMKSLLSLLFAVCIAGPVAAAEMSAPSAGWSLPLGEARVYKTADGRDLTLHILKPEGWQAADKRPAMIFFHGGGWIGGTPAQFNGQGHHLASRGMVVVQVQYRFIKAKGEAPLAACLDARSAMRWVRGHAAELGIDPQRIAAGGGSAGGHLAAYVGMVDGQDDPADDARISPKPDAMVLFNPALLHGEEERQPPEAQRPAFKSLSPWANVSPDDPPGLILVGSEDGLLLPHKVKEFQALCEKNGVRMDAVIYPGEGHGFFGLKKSEDRFYDTVREMEKFLASLGWIEGAPTLTQDQVKEYGRLLYRDLTLKKKKKEKDPGEEKAS